VMLPMAAAAGAAGIGSDKQTIESSIGTERV
jgi:hypothetical protein